MTTRYQPSLKCMHGLTNRACVPIHNNYARIDLKLSAPVSACVNVDRPEELKGGTAFALLRSWPTGCMHTIVIIIIYMTCHEEPWLFLRDTSDKFVNYTD